MNAAQTRGIKARPQKAHTLRFGATCTQFIAEPARAAFDRLGDGARRTLAKAGTSLGTRLRSLALVLVSGLLFALLLPFPAYAGGCPRACDVRLVVLRDQPDLHRSFGATRPERQRNLVTVLRTHAESAQRSLLAALQARQRTGRVGQVTPLWIQNALLVQAEPAVFAELGRRSDVAVILPERTFDGPAVTKPIAAASELESAAVVQPNIVQVNAPALWERGLRGDGIVVASMDTGVDALHPELAPQYRGGSNSWYDPYGQHPGSPIDLNGHGTWTMGLMVGGNASGSAIGVAPHAQWIAVKIFNDRNQATTSAIHLGLQWLLDPDQDPTTPDAPHVVNNSWTYGGPGCNLEFEPDLAALAAAGIVPVFAGGNFGPNASSDASPANNPSAFPSGAVDAGDVVYVDSSRGPTNCGGASRSYPALVAPGVDTLTTDLYGMYTHVTGTSFAAPHVAGGLALLLDAYPDLTAEQQRQAFVAGAFDLGPDGPDNIYGAGRLDVLAAYQALAASDSTLFADGFESGDLGAWTASQLDGGRLVVTSTAALAGVQGLAAHLGGALPIYVADGSPAAETRYNARFYYSPAGANLPRGLPHGLFAVFDAAGQVVARVEVQSMSRKVEVRAVARSGGADIATPWSIISSTGHALELGWNAASSAASSDGQLTLYIDGVAQATVNGLSTGDQRIEEARLGLYAGAPSAAWGVESFDAFVSTRGVTIGP